MSRHGARRRAIAAVVGMAAAAGTAGLALADAPADFAVSGGRLAPGETATFTAQASCAAPVTCTWDFGDGAGATGGEVTHAYADPGTRTVTLTLDDPDDPAEPSVHTQSVTVDARPVAAFSVSPQNPRKNDTVTFDATASSDPDGDPLTYRWDFDGDGTPDGEGVQITHSYPAVGSYQATLTVDDGRLTHSVFTTVDVGSAAPTAAITPSTTSPTTGQAVTFTSTASDPDGSIAGWAWDLDGDGQFDDGTTPAVSATFDTPGPRAVALRVTDDDGQTADAQVTVTVLNRDPVADFTWSPDPIPQGQPVTLTSQSTDPEGRLVTQDWDLDGDGAYDDASGSTAQVTFPDAARRTVGLRVTDADGGAAEKRVELQPGNQPPQADFAITPPSPLSGETVTFNSTAQDADGTIAATDWDLDGNGGFGDASGAVATTAFAIPGTRTVRMRVTDDRGAAATAQKTFTVLNRPPVAAFDVPTVVTNQPVVFTSTSTDPEGRLTSIAWDLNGDGVFDDGEGPTATRVFATTAKVAVSLRVADADGGQAIATVDVVPGNESPVASFTQSPGGTVLTGDPIGFTSTSSDADGGIAGVEWDFGSGFTAGDATVQTSFPTPGQYPVRLRVTDTNGATATAESVVTVGNRPPVARFTYAPQLVVKGQPVTFTSRSSDPEARLAGLEWDLDGDGAFDDGTGAEVKHAFNGSGPTTVGLRARDVDGGEDVFRLSIVPGNKAPSASIDVAPATTGLGAAFNATVGDDDGTVTKVEWDFDDDGAFDDGTGTSEFWTFPAAGTYRVSVRATDDDGSSTIASRRVTVGGAGASTAGRGGPAATAPATAPRAVARLSLISPWPVVRIAGSLTRRGADLRLVSVRAPRGARVAVRCQGRCPRPSLRRVARKRVLRLTPYERPLRAGTRLEIRVLSGARIGKYTRILIRKGKSPARRDACVWPGARAPRACPP